MKCSKDKLALVKLFLQKTLGLDESVAIQEASLVAGILSDVSVKNLIFTIQNEDVRRLGEAVECPDCSFAKLSEHPRDCQFIHSRCAAWH